MEKIKVLFISSGNSYAGISPIVKRQGDSLNSLGIEVFFFTIKGASFKGYLRNLKPLNAVIRDFQPDVIHAHYSLSGYLAALSGAKPLVVSLMGSDVKHTHYGKILIRIINLLFWNHLIVKSEDMMNNLGLKNLSVIPNGVDLNVFYPMDKRDCQEKLGWQKNKKHILFAANPDRPEKNFSMAKEILTASGNADYLIHCLTNIPPDQIPTWLNASDIVLLTSLWEGSPNVIKEAMACCRPIMCTNVGDIKHLFGDVPGHFIISNDIYDGVRKLDEAIRFSDKFNTTHGRSRLINLGLDSESVALRILKIYQDVQ